MIESYIDNSVLSETNYYLLDDKRIWSIKEAKFVETTPKNAVFSSCSDENGNSSLEGLIECLHFYGYPLGELKTDAEYASEIRTKRDELLAETDYLIMPDYPLSDEKRQTVSAYRQALRDIPEQSGFPRQINWPEKNF